MGGASSSERRQQQQQQQQRQAQQQQQQQRAPAPVVPQQQQHPAPITMQRGGALPPMQAAPRAPAPQPASGGGAVSEAQTIKNECALVVESVQFDPTSRLLKWKTNSTVAAEMEVHVAVRVDVMHKHVMITPNIAKEPPPRIGVNVGESVAHEHFLDIEKCKEQELTYIQEYPRQFPVIIVLFYKTQEGHNQAEFSGIQLKPTCRVVKQLIRAREEVYKVEHLFGGEHAEFGTVVGDNGGAEGAASPAGGVVASSPAGGEEDDDGLCVICLTNEKNTIVMPCRHMCLCKECAEELRQRQPKCPVCRGPANQLVAVRAPSTSPAPQ